MFPMFAYLGQLLNSSKIVGHVEFQKKNYKFPDRRTHEEHNAKVRLSRSRPHPEKTSSQFARPKKTDRNSSIHTYIFHMRIDLTYLQ